METLNNKPIPDKNNDDSDLHNDELGENSGADTVIAKEAALEPGEISIDKMDSSNKGQGPAGEGL
jgi:hypothetical protein